MPKNTCVPSLKHYRFPLVISREFVHCCVTSRVSAQRAKAIAQLFCEERRLFKRSEMTAAIEFIPVNEPGIDALGPTARCGNNLAREDAASHRKIYHAAIVLCDDSRMLKINACRRGRGVRQPIKRDIVEHLVACERRFRIAVVVGPGVKFLVDPGGLSHGRVRESVADGLRSRRLL